MLGMGPLIWCEITKDVAGKISPSPGYRYPKWRKDVRYYTGRYYRAIDAINRGERRVCSCDLSIPQHDITGRPLKLKAFP